MTRSATWFLSLIWIAKYIRKINSYAQRFEIVSEAAWEERLIQLQTFPDLTDKEFP